MARGRAFWMRLGVAGAVLAGVAALALGGCSTVGYYTQSVTGHLDLMQKARPVADVQADPAQPQDLRDRLGMAQRMRAYAVRRLALPDNASYTRYADLGRGAAVWNVVAAPELSLTPYTWCFVVVGCVGYRGYFDRADADATAATLRAQGLEVAVYGVPAYSTLGWMNWLGGDPLLNTFIRWPEGDLARIVFHELAHQVTYAEGDTMFNESYATAVERLGVALWLADEAGDAARAEYATLDARRRDFKALSAATRAQLDALYRSPASDDEKRRRKAELMAAMRAEHQRLKAGPWGGATGYDGWFERANNALLAVQAAYDEQVPAFERLFEQQGGDFARFHAEVKRLAALPKAERDATLRALMP